MAYVPPTTLSGLREYVGGAQAMQQAAESTVLLHVSHAHLAARFPEVRLDRHMTIDAVKAKLSSMTGTSLSSMTLLLKDETGKLVAALADGSAKLGLHSPRDGWCIHVLDSDSNSLAAQGWLEDVSKVTKYVMSEADYAARDNTYRRYKEAKLQQDPTWTLEKEMCQRRGGAYTPPAQVGPDHLQELACSLQPGQRCCVAPGERRGEIRFVGRVTRLGQGFWVGVALDEPLGRNDGSLQGTRYFSCPAAHGSFVRPDKVQVGDFPPFDDLDSSDEV